MQVEEDLNRFVPTSSSSLLASSSCSSASSSSSSSLLELSSFTSVFQALGTAVFSWNSRAASRAGRRQHHELLGSEHRRRHSLRPETNIRKSEATKHQHQGGRTVFVYIFLTKKNCENRAVTGPFTVWTSIRTCGGAEQQKHRGTTPQVLSRII